ncbi:MAG: transglutaminase family protein [Acidimicrobiales bacterium]
MAWRMSIEHCTRYRYSALVATSYNEARLTPLTTPSQTTLDSSVVVSPPAFVSRYWDYWGTLVHAIEVHQPHTELEVKGHSVVEGPDQTAPPARVQGWEALEDPAAQDRLCEYLAPSAWVPADTQISEVGAALRARSQSPADAVAATLSWVGDQLHYEAGATTVSTSAVEAWRAGLGVCQDFVHLSVALLRAAGVPARYVSGYLHPDPDPVVGSALRGESHAWLEAWTGDWTAHDPTNRAEVGERHVVVARGRDYGDVAPLKGIYSGGSAAQSEVTVTLTRLA